MNTFTINSITYKSIPFDFNLICEFEDMGISLESMGDKPMSLIRAYFSIASKLSIKDAGLQMQQHMINGGNFDELQNAITKEMDESDFFHSLTKTPEKKTPKSKAQKE